MLVVSFLGVDPAVGTTVAEVKVGMEVVIARTVEVIAEVADLGNL